jgi:hypothetical protein
MKKNAQIYSVSSLIILLALSGCAHYHPKSSLSNLNTGISQQTKESTISFNHHVFSTDDCLRYLDRNIIARGYQPVNITFTNNTKYSLTFSTKSFSFPCALVEEVAEKAHTNTKGRAVGYGVASLCVPILWIPAVVDGVGSSKANKKLNADFSRKSLRDQVVNPFSTVSGLIFVPTGSFNPNFTFVVNDFKNDKKYTLSSSNPILNIKN